MTKLDPALPPATALIYSTYLGGTPGDAAYAIAVDGSGAVYLVGETGSSTFPVKNAYDDRLNCDSDGFLPS